MNERERDDMISARLVMALDALPVPAAPGGFSVATRRQPDRLLVIVATLALLFIAFVSAQPVRDAASETTKFIQRVLFGPPWSGYYVDLAARDASGQPMQRLLHAAGSFPGTPTRPVVEGSSVDRGAWSPDGEHIAIQSGSRIFVGDRQGSVRQLVDLGSRFFVQRTGWVGSDRLFAAVDTTDNSGGWVVTVELATGAADLRRLESFTLGGSFAFASPDGRWLPVTAGLGPCGENSRLYELGTHRIVDVLDADGQPAFAVGWLNDGRLVSATCDRANSRGAIFVGPPGVRPAAAIATLSLPSGAPFFFVDRASDRIMLFNAAATEPQIVPVLDSTGRVTRTLHISQLTSNGEISQINASRDGKFITFRLLEIRGAERIIRAGLIDLATGQVTFACDANCSRLLLR